YSGTLYCPATLEEPPMARNFARIMAALAIALCASAARAQFDGIFFGAGMGLYKATIQVPDSFTFGNDKHTAGLNLDAGYGRVLAQSRAYCRIPVVRSQARRLCSERAAAARLYRRRSRRAVHASLRSVC